MTPLTDIALYENEREAGFPIIEAIIMACVALRESAGIPDVVNNNPDTKDYSIGLHQINWLYQALFLQSKGFSKNDLQVPLKNAQAAVCIWAKNDNNLDTAWYINRAGYKEAWQKFLPRILDAAIQSNK